MKVTYGAYLTITNIPSKEVLYGLMYLAKYPVPFKDRNGKISIKQQPSYYQVKGGLLMPRGAMFKVKEYCEMHKVPLRITYETNKSPSLPDGVEFKGELRDIQKDIVKAIGNKRTCLAEAATGSGKTVLGCYLVAKRKVPTVIIVHSVGMLGQWKQELLHWLDGIDEDDIGILGGGRREIRPLITIGTFHSISKMTDEIQSKMCPGLVIADEAHKIGGKQYQDCINKLAPAWTVGMSATPLVNDSPRLPEIYFGRRINVPSSSKKALVDNDVLTSAEVHIHDVDARVYGATYGECVTMYTEDQKVNDKIVELIKEDLTRDRAGYDGACLVLFDRVDHLAHIGERLTELGIEYGELHGGVSPKKREVLQDTYRQGKGPKVLLGNTAVASTGLNVKCLDTLILGSPSKAMTKVVQSLGRILRSDKGKTLPSVIHDIQCWEPVFVAGIKSRLKAYHEQSIEIIK